LLVQKVASAKWEVESESGRLDDDGNVIKYTILYNSPQAKGYGVDYSCNCKAWINNVDGDRTCKHTREIERLIATNVMNTYSSAMTKINTSSYPSRRGRGRPSRDITAYCKACGKRTIRMKDEGICGNKSCPSLSKSYYKQSKTPVPYKNYTTRRHSVPDNYVPPPPTINDDTVEIKDESIDQIAERLGLDEN
jgi:hypothetical protein